MTVCKRWLAVCAHKNRSGPSSTYCIGNLLPRCLGNPFLSVSKIKVCLSFHPSQHIPEGLQPPQRFLERVAVHFARNILAGEGGIPGQVPLILGIWGAKGGGKSFNLELCLKQMGVQPVCISAGELEDEWAGEPGRRIRERYRFASRHAAATGEATCVIISDLDAGVGRFAHTGNTVNTQILQGTLMALSDDPLCVSTGQDYEAVGEQRRVPIYVTANDLTCLYAPLVREGRMDKFFFDPSREEMATVLSHLFNGELTEGEVDSLLSAFPQQALDFFGSIKSRLADASVRAWLRETRYEAIGPALVDGEEPVRVEVETRFEDALAAGDLPAAQTNQSAASPTLAAGRSVRRCAVVPQKHSMLHNATWCLSHSYNASL